MLQQSRHQNSLSISGDRCQQLYPLIIPIVTFLLFYQGVGAGYLFDDLTSIVPLKELQSHPQLFWRHVFSNGSGPLGRPLSMMTFAWEQAYLHATADTSQITSIVLHCANSLLVFLLARQVFILRHQSQATSYALLVALIWCLSPQKASSVLYIVQRMAMLSTFFVLLAMVFYIHARLESRKNLWCIFILLSALFTVAAPFAKENGVLALPMIAALEVFAIPRQPCDSRWGNKFKIMAYIVLAVGLVGLICLGVKYFISADVAFVQRQFTFSERLLSTPIVLIDYAKQFYMPDTSRMGLFHDDFTANLWSYDFFFGFVFLIGSGLILIRSLLLRAQSIFAFSLSIFLVGHSLESTVVPLELYFEHRNYLPSIGLALIIPAAMTGVLSKTRFVGGKVQLVFLSGYLAALLFSALLYIPTWGSYRSLLLHQLSGHPESARVHAEYAIAAAEGGRLDVAYKNIDKALELSRRFKASGRLASGDRVAMRVAAACLANEGLESAIPKTLLLGDDSLIYSRAVRVLANLVAEEKCPEADWEMVSEWFKTVIINIYESDGKVLPYALRDLALFERELKNYTHVFMYAGMAAEASPNDGLLQILRLEAALAANDYLLANKLLPEVERLRAEGKLRPVDAIFLERLKVQ